jgi:hypothetical protein
MKTLKSCRDITVIENTPFIVIATDSSGSLGEQEADHLVNSPDYSKFVQQIRYP